MTSNESRSPAQKFLELCSLARNAAFGLLGGRSDPTQTLQRRICARRDRNPARFAGENEFGLRSLVVCRSQEAQHNTEFLVVELRTIVSPLKSQIRNMMTGLMLRLFGIPGQDWAYRYRIQWE